MKELAIILPYKKDSNEREKNYYFIKKRYKNFFPESQILISEDNSNTVYNKSKAINSAIRYVRNDIKYLMIADTDIIINKLTVIHSISLLEKYGLILPYNKILKLDEESSNKILNEDPTLDDYTYNNINYEKMWTYDRKPNYLGGGGIQILKKETFENLNGYNTFFKGWGDEDICFCIHLSLNNQIYKFKNTVYHLYHPIQTSKKTTHKDLNQQMRRIHENIYNNSFLTKNQKNNLFFILKEPQKIDFLATEEHFVDHLLPIYNSLPKKHQGNFYTTQLATNLEWSIYKNQSDIIKEINSVNNHRLLFLSSLLTNTIQKINRPIGWIAHGAGQTYNTARWRYSNNDNLYLALCPNEHYYNYVKTNSKCKNIKIVGSPKLDKWYNYKKEKNEKPVVAISFHHDRKACPESHSSFPHFKNILPQLFTQSKWKILGHGHPRIIDQLIPIYDQYNIEYTRDFEEVLRKADLYICDHMSTLYEFAAVDNKPVVVLNAPWYRRDVEHGLRFWEHCDIGINCDNPEYLLNCVELGLKDNEKQRILRQKCLKAVYKYQDGKSTQRATDELIKLVNSREYIIDVFENILNLNSKKQKPMVYDNQQLSNIRKRMLKRQIGVQRSQ